MQENETISKRTAFLLAKGAITFSYNQAESIEETMSMETDTFMQEAYKKQYDLTMREIDAMIFMLNLILESDYTLQDMYDF